MEYVAKYVNLAIIEILNQHWVQKMTTMVHLTRMTNGTFGNGLLLMLHRIDAIHVNQENSSLINKEAHVFLAQQVNTEILGWPPNVKIAQLDNS